MNKIALIIPAAGSGVRLNTQTPKPFISIAGKPVLAHTLNNFWELKGLSKVIIATPSSQMEQVKSLLAAIVPDGITSHVVEGGQERQHSIYNGLKIVDDCNYVIVHDAVRPFVKPKHIEACYVAAVKVGASVLGVKAKDTIKRAGDDDIVTETPSRKALWQAQTPQFFKTTLLTEAYKAAFNEGFLGTDDASLVERLGHKVKMVEGDHSNFKITYPLDLKLAQILLEER